MSARLLFSYGKVNDELFFEFLSSVYLFFHIMIDVIHNAFANFLFFFVQNVSVFLLFCLFVLLLALFKQLLHDLFFLFLANQILFSAYFTYFPQSFSIIEVKLADFGHVAANLFNIFHNVGKLLFEIGYVIVHYFVKIVPF